MKAMTLRGIDPETAGRLKKEAAEQGKSVNQLILDIINKNLGMEKEKIHSRTHHDLDTLFGRWSDEEYESIQSRIAQDRAIDKDLWS